MVRGFAIVGLEDVTSDYASRIKSTNSSAGESSLTSWYTEFACWWWLAEKMRGGGGRKERIVDFRS